MSRTSVGKAHEDRRTGNRDPAGAVGIDGRNVQAALFGPDGHDAVGNFVGDGVEIDASELAMVQSICQQCEFTRPWRQGDLLVLDNHLTLHGRKPFTGAREILVAMA